jgi:SMP-30/Gluconolactonase/LRE-like region
MDQIEPVTLVTGFSYPGYIQWHDGALWFADLMDRCVYRVVGEQLEVVCSFEGIDMPCGIAFLPDGTPLVAGMRTAKVFAIEDGHPVTYADLSALDVGGGLLDIAVDSMGRAFVGVRARRRYLDHDIVTDSEGRVEMDMRARSGFHLDAGDTGAVSEPLELRHIERIALIRCRGDDGEVVATEVNRPGGIALTPDGSQLIVSDGDLHRLVSFPILSDGHLGQREVVMELPYVSDGLCTDIEGGIWIGSPPAGRFDRILNGKVVASFSVSPAMAVSPGLGGPDGRTLFMAVSETGMFQFRSMWDDEKLPEARETSSGWINAATVDVPGWT